MKKIIILITSFLSMLSFTSCFNDLNTQPLDQTLFTADKAYNNDEAYLQGLAKLYASFGLPGNSGPASSEIAGIDAGTSVFERVWWYAQEFTTDEVKWAQVNDAGTPEMDYTTFTPTNVIVQGLYYRLAFMTTLFNDYLKQTAESQVRARGQDALLPDINKYRSEARLLRALTYYYFMDLYGNVPFITENDPIGSYIPPQISRKDLYNYIESECLALDNDPNLADPGTNQYGRCDKAVLWMLLSRLYLNSEVYLSTVDESGNVISKGPQNYDKAKQYAEKVIDCGKFALSPRYAELFMADNGENPTARQEIIFAIRNDGEYTQSYATYQLVNGSRGSNDASFAYTSGAYKQNNGNRTTLAFIRNSFWEDIDSYMANGKIDDPVTTAYQRAAGDVTTPLGLCPASIAGTLGEYVYNTDNRGIFFTRQCELPMSMNAGAPTFIYGWPSYKWSNVTSDGNVPYATMDANGLLVAPQFQNIDYPLMRLAEAYLNYAEACVRLSGGTCTDAKAVSLLNALLDRANSSSPRITEFNLEYIFKERGRELYWEGFRRTDLIRWDRYAGTNYQWEFKGAPNGNDPTPLAVPQFRCLFPIPQSDMAANPNLKQNPGY